MEASDDKAKPGPAARAERLAAALRENLRKRKAQARGRSEAGGSESADPPGNAPAEPRVRES